MILKSSKGASLAKEKQIPCFPSISFISQANKCKSLRRELSLWFKALGKSDFPLHIYFISCDLVSCCFSGYSSVYVQGYKYLKFDLLGL